MLTTGVDIIEVDRIARALNRHGDRFLTRVFTPAEILYCRNHVPELAVRFAAKEAVSKALGIGMRLLARGGINWKDVEVIGDGRGKPLVHLYGRAAARSAELALNEWAISLSHSGQYAIAFVVAQ